LEILKRVRSRVSRVLSGGGTIAEIESNLKYILDDLKSVENDLDLLIEEAKAEAPYAVAELESIKADVVQAERNVESAIEKCERY